MMISQEIKKILLQEIMEIRKVKVVASDLVLEFPEDERFGDYSANFAMRRWQDFGFKNPREFANFLAKKLQKDKDLAKIVSKIEVAGPGFINFFLKGEFFVEEIKRILKEKNKYGKSKNGKNKTVIFDYSSPNIAKPFGIGHLRSTIIGQALYNIYKFLGFKCIGDNHLGDWGTQFGKLIVAVKKWGEKKTGDYSIEDLEELYIKFHKESEKNPKIEEEGRKWFKKLEEGDKEAKKIWRAFVKISLKEFTKIYKLLGIKIDYALGESFYEEMLKDIIKEAKEKKIAIESQEALIIKYPHNELPPAMILKSDGATTYLTRDLATVKYRLKKWKPDLIIYEIGVDQELHLKQLFRAVELLGWVNPVPEPSVRYGARFFHVAHGLYRTKTGKFSTRRGETIHLEEVLKEAIERAREIIHRASKGSEGEKESGALFAKNSETGRGLSEEEKEKVAKMVGIGAVKYNDLSQHYSKDIIFDWEKILNLKGNSAPYLQYTFVRCQSVLRKVKFKTLPKKIEAINFNLEEKDILREIYKFPEIVQEAAEKFSPNLICNFIFDLAQKYNFFYDLHPILKAKTEELKIFRLVLTMAVAQVLKNSFNLLGISAPEKM